MNTYHSLLLLLLCALLPTSTLSANSPPLLDLSPCRLANTTIKANCGTLKVAENPAAQAGNTIDLHFAVVPATGNNPKPDPLFMFAGGPGQGAIEAFAPLIRQFSQLRLERDIVLIDQRGTGNSNPLHCPADDSIFDSSQPQQEAISQYISDCLQELPGDPRYYTTEVAVQDFEKVRRALGYKQINLLGVSYGTRVAQTYMRRFPAMVRSVIIDGVVPVDLILGTEHADKLQQTLTGIFERCAADAQCNALFPQLEQKLATLIQRTEQNPVTLKLPAPRSGELKDISVNRDTLALAIRLLSYAPETQALLPLLIHEAAIRNDLSRIARQALLVQQDLQTSISRGMEWSVICSEDAPKYPTPPVNNNGTLLGNSMITASKEVCANWPKGKVPADIHIPFKSNIPTLLLSGEFDPVTPPEYGQRASEQFSNSLHITARGQGHSIISRGCMPSLIADFLDSTDPATLDTSCINHFGTTPFFTSLMGSEP